MNGICTGARLFAVALVTSTFAVVWVGCSDDHGDAHSHGTTDRGAHTSLYPACNEITVACHAVDKEEGPIHTCHDEAHAAKSNDDCVPKKDNCLKICREAAAADADAGEGHDGG